MENILVTGANGFIGRELCKRLITDGFNVRAAIRTTDKINQMPSGVISVQVGNNFSKTDWPSVLDGIEGIVHLAARVHVMQEQSSDPLSEYRRVNFLGTENLACQAASAGVKRFVYLSSIKVNGEGRIEPYKESDEEKPKNPYAVSKLEAEVKLQEIAVGTTLEVVIIRPPLVYGPGVKGNLVRLKGLIAKGIPLPLASIKNRRSFIYIGNLVDSIVTCLRHPKAAGEIFFVSDFEDLSTPELIRQLAISMGKKARLFPFPVYLLNYAGKLTGKSDAIDRLVGSLCADTQKIRKELNWKAIFSLQEGMRRSFPK